MGMFMGLSMSPEAHILLVDVPTQLTVSIITKEYQIQLARVIFNHFIIFTKCLLVYFIVISFPLQDLNFVKKELKVIIKDPKN